MLDPAFEHSLSQVETGIDLAKLCEGGECPAELTALAQEDKDPASCWLKSQVRGAGQVLTHCRSGLDKDGALCYPHCNSGYTGVGPVCWQDCPSGFRNDGAFCAKPSSYGRGAGSFWSCSGCERWGLLYYPKCATNFHNAGCCICSPNCPSGMTDIGVSCAKDTYGRGVGEALRCAPGLEQDGLLCYNQCTNGNGIGPVCWGGCPAGTE